MAALLVTGVNGTLGPVLADVLSSTGKVVSWNRETHAPEDLSAAQNLFDTVQPAGVFHLATGSELWAELIASLCRTRMIPLIYTSSVSVFSSRQQGPFSVEDIPLPDDDYGRYKHRCEKIILQTCPHAAVARIGWQIGYDQGGNHMVDHLIKIHEREGHIQASTQWFQACSFLGDTARGLLRLFREKRQGLYHLDSNHGLSFYEIVKGLNALLKVHWNISPDSSPVLNNRLLDDRLQLPPLDHRFGRNVI